MNIEEIRNGFKLHAKRNEEAKERFEKAEERERLTMIRIFKQTNVPPTHYSFTPVGDKLRHDGYLTGRTNEALFETKARECKSTTYKTTIIELSKVKYLQTKMKEEGKQGLIFFAFEDNKWMVVEINAFKEYPSSDFLCPSTTKGNREMVYKVCVEFEIKNLKNL